MAWDFKKITLEDMMDYITTNAPKDKAWFKSVAIDANGKFVKAEGGAVKVGKAYQSGVAGDYIKALLK